MAKQHAKNTHTGSSSNGEPVYLNVGFLRRPHGVRGEIMLEIQTEHPEIFLPEAQFYLGEEYTPYIIASSRPHKKGILLSFNGIQDRDKVGEFRNTHVYAKISELPDLPEKDFYDYELIGLEIVEEETGKSLGKLKEIIKTGANDVYVVEKESGSEILLPAIPEVVLDIDLSEGQMSVFLLDGLIA
ncbi:MAG: 16S rRNA processing protein RimM [Anaerolineae bacterium]|jgi:16S rRNA processing protein RimM|nr:16S rRNA processing protein RimM [Anaerolineae bacterium]MBT7075266.1 16S rRNA processing protein RimM [Anaerolineae bacterium]MBT7783210.1 16S rRNA processing protein RimM [Anaerolineae bacterium]